MHRVHLLVLANFATIDRELTQSHNSLPQFGPQARGFLHQCKHVLAVTLAEKTGRCQTIEMAREQIGSLLSST